MGIKSISIRHRDEALTPKLNSTSPAAADGLQKKTNRRARRIFKRMKDAVKPKELVLVVGG